MGATGESVAVPPLRWPQYFRRAFRTDHRVGRNLRVNGASHALGDPEVCGQRAFIGARIDRFDTCQRGWLAFDPVDEFVDP